MLIQLTIIITNSWHWQKKLGEDKYINLAVFNKAVINQYSGKSDSAFLNYQYLRNHISEKDTFSYMRLINATGNYYQDAGYLDTALIYFKTLLNKSREYDLELYKLFLSIILQELTR